MTTNELGGMHNKIVPRTFEDLRGWIEALRDEGELQEIDVEVDWDCELGTIARKTFGQGHGPALLFNNIGGYGPDDDVYSRRVFTGGLSNYTRVAMMLGLPKDAPVRDLVLATRHFLQQRVEPVEVFEGKVKENIVTGDDIDIYLFLIHISEPTRLGMNSYAVFCLKKNTFQHKQHQQDTIYS